MSIEEIVESIPDTDLEIAIREIYDINNGLIASIYDTMILNELYSTLEEYDFIEDGMETLQVGLLCLQEYSFRKAGLK